jgi:hypothetical protein
VPKPTVPNESPPRTTINAATNAVIFPTGYFKGFLPKNSDPADPSTDEQNIYIKGDHPFASGRVGLQSMSAVREKFMPQKAKSF